MKTGRFLIEEVGGGGALIWENTGRWVEDLARTREMIADQRAVVERLKLCRAVVCVRL